MEILNAVDIFLKFAQAPSTTTPAATANTANLNNALNEIKRLSNILSDPHIKEDLSSGLIFTLDYKIKQQKNNEAKITDPKAKKLISGQMSSDLNNLTNSVKLFYSSLAVQPIDLNNSSNYLITLKNNWTNFRNNDLNDAWLQLVLQQNNQNVQTWWKKLRQKIDDTIRSIDLKVQEAKKYTVPIVS